MADIDDLLNPVGPADGSDDHADLPSALDEQGAAEQPSEAHPMGAAVTQHQELLERLYRMESAAAALRQTDGALVNSAIHHAGETSLAPEQVSAVLRDAGLPPDVAAGASDPDAVRRAAAKHFPGSRPAAQITALTFEQGEVRLTVTTGSPAEDKAPEVRRDTARVWGAMTGWRVMERGKGGKLVVASDAQAATRVATARMVREMPRAVAWLVTGQKDNWRGHGPKDDVRLSASVFSYFVQKFGAAPSVLERTKGWRSAMQEAGLLDAERQPDGTTRYGCPTVKRVAIFGDTAALVVRTKPRITLAQWERSREVLGVLLGVQGLRISSPVAGEIWLAPPMRPERVSQYVPTAREMVHINGATGVLRDAPANDRLVFALAAAQAAYEETNWILGRTGDGDVLKTPAASAPHVLAAGATGSGKTTWVQWLVSMLAAAGGDIAICDGKGSTGYDGIARGLPNVRFLTKKPVEHIAALRWVYAEMHRRFDSNSDASRNGLPTTAYRPLYVVFDEYASFRQKMASTAGPRLQAAAAEVEGWITEILQEAREAKIHLIFISQSIYAKTYTGDQLANMQVRVSWGRLTNDRTLQAIAEGSGSADAVREVNATIPAGKQGRGVGLTMLVDDEGSTRPRKVSAPYGFAPGTECHGELAQRVWPETEAEVYSRQVSLAPRMALVLDHPVEVEDLGKKVPPPRSWEEYGMHEIAQLPWVQLGTWNGISAPVDTSRYDCLSPEYAFGRRASAL